MRGLLQRVLGTRAEKPIPYEESKRLSVSTDVSDRQRVAEHTSVRPELLYYLANDPDPRVRAAVAGNEATPVQADLLLARDREAAVREDLAHKISRLAPGLTATEQDRLRKMTYEVLEILVRDEIVRVRQIIAETLKDVVDAPPEIIQRLARDCEIAVAGPILQFSPILSDEDLLAIISGDPVAGTRRAVASREPLRETVSDAIGTSGDVDAITALLANPSAQIREEMLDQLIDLAPSHLPWHAPLVHRPRLRGDSARRLARFVATSLLSVLRDRRDFDPATTQEISATVMARVAEEGADPPVERDPTVAALKRARQMKAQKKLDDVAVDKALDQGDRVFARAALAVLAGLPVDAVDRVFAAHSAKGIVALAWQAQLKMHTAVRLQTGFAHLPRPSVIKALPDGGYPMTEDAMRWQIEFLTGFKAVAHERV